jgi:hypothetical protein
MRSSEKCPEVRCDKKVSFSTGNGEGLIGGLQRWGETAGVPSISVERKPSPETHHKNGVTF